MALILSSKSDKDRTQNVDDLNVTKSCSGILGPASESSHWNSLEFSTVGSNNVSFNHTSNNDNKHGFVVFGNSDITGKQEPSPVQQINLSLHRPAGQLSQEEEQRNIQPNITSDDFQSQTQRVMKQQSRTTGIVGEGGTYYCKQCVRFCEAVCLKRGHISVKGASLRAQCDVCFCWFQQLTEMSLHHCNSKTSSVWSQRPESGILSRTGNLPARSPLSSYQWSVPCVTDHTPYPVSVISVAQGRNFFTSSSNQISSCLYQDSVKVENVAAGIPYSGIKVPANVAVIPSLRTPVASFNFNSCILNGSDATFTQGSSINESQMTLKQETEAALNLDVERLAAEGNAGVPQMTVKQETDTHRPGIELVLKVESDQPITDSIVNSSMETGTDFKLASVKVEPMDSDEQCLQNPDSDVNPFCFPEAVLSQPASSQQLGNAIRTDQNFLAEKTPVAMVCSSDLPAAVKDEFVRPASPQNKHGEVYTSPDYLSYQGNHNFQTFTSETQELCVGSPAACSSQINVSKKPKQSAVTNEISEGYKPIDTGTESQSPHSNHTPKVKILSFPERTLKVVRLNASDHAKQDHMPVPQTQRLQNHSEPIIYPFMHSGADHPAIIISLKHKFTHSKQFYCKQCIKFLNQICLKRGHITVHRDRLIGNCEVCRRWFETTAEMKKDKKQHTVSESRVTKPTTARQRKTKELPAIVDPSTTGSMSLTERKKNASTHPSNSPATQPGVKRSSGKSKNTKVVQSSPAKSVAVSTSSAIANKVSGSDVHSTVASRDIKLLASMPFIKMWYCKQCVDFFYEKCHIKGHKTVYRTKLIADCDVCHRWFETIAEMNEDQCIVSKVETKKTTNPASPKKGQKSKSIAKCKSSSVSNSHLLQSVVETSQSVCSTQTNMTVRYRTIPASSTVTKDYSNNTWCPSVVPLKSSTMLPAVKTYSDQRRNLVVCAICPTDDALVPAKKIALDTAEMFSTQSETSSLNSDSPSESAWLHIVSESSGVTKTCNVNTRSLPATKTAVTSLSTSGVVSKLSSDRVCGPTSVKKVKFSNGIESGTPVDNIISSTISAATEMSEWESLLVRNPPRTSDRALTLSSKSDKDRTQNADDLNVTKSCSGILGSASESSLGKSLEFSTMEPNNVSLNHTSNDCNKHGFVVGNADVTQEPSPVQQINLSLQHPAGQLSQEEKQTNIQQNITADKHLMKRQSFKTATVAGTGMYYCKQCVRFCEEVCSDPEHISVKRTSLQIQCDVCFRWFQRLVEMSWHDCNYNTSSDQTTNSTSSETTANISHPGLQSTSKQIELSEDTSSKPDHDSAAPGAAGNPVEEIDTKRNAEPEEQENADLCCSRCKIYFKTALRKKYHICFYMLKKSRAVWSSNIPVRTCRTLPRTVASVSCDICSAKLSNTDLLKIHRAYEHNVDQTDYECHVCGLEVTRKSDLNLHFSRCHKEELQCPFCDKICKSLVRKQYHMRLHESMCLCEVCGRRFFHHKRLVIHLMDKHGEYVDKNYLFYQCNICSKGFDEAEVLKHHLRDIHFLKITNLRNYIRKVDNNELLKYQKAKLLWINLRKAKLVSAKKKKPEKKIAKCKKPVTVWKRPLIEPKHVCPYCGKLYSTKGISHHIDITHDSEYVPGHQCDHCQKRFHCYDKLVGHIKNTHLGIKQTFVCQLCNRTFCFNHALKRHIDVKHRNVRKVCLCGKAFTSQHGLKYHHAHTCRLRM